MTKRNTTVECYYLEGMSIPEVSELTGIPLSTVRNRLKRAGVLRSRKEGINIAASKGRLSWAKGVSRVFSEEWKENIRRAKLAHGEQNAAGFTVRKNGYVIFTRGPDKGKGEHVVIMERRIGRALKADECVHHIDGNPSNNAENNLALLTRSAHSRLHRLEEIKQGKIKERNENGRFS